MPIDQMILRRYDLFFFFSSRRRHTRCGRDWSSDVCSSDLPLFQSDVVFTPGAKMSTQGPKLENDAMLSLMSVAPTVSASGALAGEVLQASGAPELPAATAYTTPAAIEFSTAVFSGGKNPPPRLMLAPPGTAGLAVFCWVT